MHFFCNVSRYLLFSKLLWFLLTLNKEMYVCMHIFVQRLVLTPRFFASNEIFCYLSFSSELPKELYYTLSVSNKGYRLLCWKRFYKTSQKYLKTSQIFLRRWNISNFLGAIYGKYIVNRPPSGRVSEYLKYIKTFPITLLAIVGPESECLYVDIGSNGRMNDSDIWNNCDKQQKIENND